METLVGRVVHAVTHYNRPCNWFAVIVRDTPQTVLLAPLKTGWVEGTVTYFQGIPVQGMEKPVLSKGDLAALAEDAHTFRAKKRTDDKGETRFDAQGRSYRLWDGLAKHWNSD